MKRTLLGIAIGVLVGTAALAAPRSASVSPDFQAADCCRVIVKGCGKEARVCLPGGCSLDNQGKARGAFEKAYGCSSSSVSSYIGTCSGEKCDIDLR